MRHQYIPDMLVHSAKEVHGMDQSFPQVSWLKFVPLHPKTLLCIFLATLTNTSALAQGTGGANRGRGIFFHPTSASETV